MVGSFCLGVCSSNGIHLIYPETDTQNDEREIEESMGAWLLWHMRPVTLYHQGRRRPGMTRKSVEFDREANANQFDVN